MTDDEVVTSAGRTSWCRVAGIFSLLSDNRGATTFTATAAPTDRLAGAFPPSWLFMSGVQARSGDRVVVDDGLWRVEERFMPGRRRRRSSCQQHLGDDVEQASVA